MNNSNLENQSEDDETYKKYIYEQRIRFREVLIKVSFDQQNSYDRNVLVLASGALGVSLIFIKDIAPGPLYAVPFALFGAWALLVICLLSTLISFVTSKKAIDLQIAIVDRQIENESYADEERRRHCFSTATAFTNHASYILFILGIILLCLFAFSNFGNEVTSHEKKSQSVQLDSATTR